MPQWERSGQDVQNEQRKQNARFEEMKKERCKGYKLKEHAHVQQHSQSCQ
jgi:hypothetical protein